MIWIRLLCISFVVIIPFVSTNVNSSNPLPCEYHDSINITDGKYIGNQIKFDGITFSPDQYATVEYALDKNSKIGSVQSHIRGCICNIKPCIRTCCPHGHIRTLDKDGMVECVQNDKMNNSHIPIQMRHENGETETISAKNRFAVMHSKPPGCKRMIAWYAYAIHHTGEAIVGETKLNHSRYCISYSYDAKTEKTTEFLLFCDVSDKDDPSSVLDHNTFAVCLLLSIPFLIATILVYRFVPELYNLHGKCLLCYLISLTIGYLFLALINSNASLSPYACHTSGWIIYFSFVAAFLWLSIICYDLWSNLRTTNGYQKYSDGRVFIYYFAYAFGISATLTIISMIMNYSELLPNSLRPQLGNDNCFIKEKFGKGLYFYGPSAIILCINLVLFILTARRIRQLQRQLEKSPAEATNETHARNLHTNDGKWVLYLQLFVVMGITWIMEVILFFSEILYDSKIGEFFKVINALQGVFLFSVMVLGRRTRKLIFKRWQQCNGAQPSNTMSDDRQTNLLSMTQVD